MDLGSIFAGLSLGDADYSGSKERKARRKKRKGRRKARKTGRKAIRKTARSSRKELRQSTRGMGLLQKLEVRKKGRKAIRQRKKLLRKAAKAGKLLTPAGQAHAAAQLVNKKRAEAAKKRRAAAFRCRPGASKTTAKGRRVVCGKDSKWHPAPPKKISRPKRKLPRSTEEAMAMAAESQYQPEQYATPEEAYQAEMYPSEPIDSSSYFDGGGGGGGGGGSMEPYSAEAPADAGFEEEYDDEEEEGTSPVLIGGVALILLGWIGFYVYKKRQAGEEEDLAGIPAA